MMFTSSLTRPLRWAIPLAVLGVLAAAFWYLRVIEVDVAGETVNCGDFRFSDLVEECAALRRDRFVVSGVILTVGLLPLLVVAVRAGVLAADAIAELREDVRRLHERLDGES